jgi:hypothetical protein
MKQRPKFECDPRELANAPRLCFFSEGAENADLMGFRPTNEPPELAEYVLSGARDMLTGATSEQARLILDWGDLIVDSFTKNGRIRLFCNSVQVARDSLDFKRLNQIDFLHIVIHMLDSAQCVVGDDAGAPVELEVTPSKFCAAYALAMIYNGTRNYLSDTELRVYYLMQASFAFGIARSLSERSEEPLTDAVLGSLRRAVARRHAAMRLERDPKQAAKAQSRKLWHERRAGKHPSLRTNEQFAAECMRRWPILTSGKVILGWCTDWNKAAKVRKPQSAS